MSPSFIEAVESHVGGLRRVGRNLVGRCPFHEDRTPSFNVYEDQHYHCFGCKAHGDCVTWLVDIEHLSKGRAIAEAARRGWQAGGRRQADPTHQRSVDAEGRRRRLHSAEARWHATRDLRGTIAEAYLASRGLPGPHSRTLRFHPRMWHFVARREMPALAAGVQTPSGKFAAVQFTYLDGCEKAAVDPARITIGSPAGGAVRLGEIGSEGYVIVAEGVETAASAAILFPECGPAWATLGTSGMRSWDPPDGVTHVLVAADHDAPANGEGVKAAQALSKRLRARGILVEVKKPHQPGTDFNDLLLTLVERHMRSARQPQTS